MNVTPELDIEDAKRRLLVTAEEAKRLEEGGDGWAANEVWEDYLDLEAAIAAQERSMRAAARWLER
ncbi:MAG TPA: hypothetical protein VFV03_04545 [Solirubrobacteraceae bacterium]|nr:hypothetical protein [Solirubrobacteraceae bacterium]